MKLKHLVFLLVICVSSCVLCSGDTGAAIEKKKEYEPGFDYFKLALSWPNQFCRTKSCDPSIPKQSFTIHGLWPSFNYGSSPSNCKTTEQLTDDTLKQLEGDLLRYWPDLKNAESFSKSKSFWKYEWKKHGTCSSNKFTALQYFQKSIDLAKNYADKILQALEKRGVTPDGSTEYNRLDILNAVAEATGAVPSLSITSGKYLAEIRLCVKDDAVTLFDCDRVIFAAPPVLPPSPSPSTRTFLPPSRSTSWISSIWEII